MKSRRAVLALSCAAVVGAAPGPFELPAELSRYRDWQAGDVHAVSMAASGLCRASAESDLVRHRIEPQRFDGPHAGRYVRVFANPAAVAAVRDPAPEAFPVGSILAKEKLVTRGGMPEAVAFMIKRPPGTLPDSGDWEFRYYPEARGASYSSCVDCHKIGTLRDYVFTQMRGAAQQ